MPKSIVICCDGTWNDAQTNTNIRRTYDFLRGLLRDPKTAEQPAGNAAWTCVGAAAGGEEVVLYYQNGVGTSRANRYLGGATGEGLSRNVCHAYAFLSHRYEPGDRIYMFGFSRGAYTVRSLCGFIGAVGLMTKPTDRAVQTAYIERYVSIGNILAPLGQFSPSQVKAALTGSGLLGQAMDWLRRRFDAAPTPPFDGARIAFVGVYDTVGALGVPLPSAARVNEPFVGFHNTSLPGIVDHSVQALAVDEDRGSFAPTLWTLGPGQAVAAGQSVLQVWFPGVHSDVGGGYAHDRGIGDITLDFMLRQAFARGLVLDPARPAPDTRLAELPPQHRSIPPVSDVEDIDIVRVRAIGPTVAGADGTVRAVAGDVRLHRSLVDRFGKTVKVLRYNSAVADDVVYTPPNVKADTFPAFG